jgi:ParB-like nuclease domain
MNELFETQKRRVSDLVPSDRNPRKMTANEQRKLQERIGKYGFISIPAITHDNQILSGTQRIKDLMRNGYGDLLIDVRVATRPLTQEEHQEILVIENTHAGEWDMDILASDFASIIALDDFNIGFDDYLKQSEKELHEHIAEPEPEMPIVAKLSEKYTAFVVIVRNEIDETHIAEKLGIERGRCYKSSKVGAMHVIEGSKLIATWKQ